MGRGTIPVNVDAICFWLVRDVKRAILEGENSFEAVTLSARTARRDIIGRHELAIGLGVKGDSEVSEA